MKSPSTLSNTANCWIIKSEPSTYSWDTFVKDKKTFWNGVRNYESRNNMSAMKVGDLVLFYHSGDERSIVGIARVTREAYPDHTATDPRWVMVDIEAVKPLKQHVELGMIKATPELREINLVRQGRLSVSPISEREFKILLVMGETKM